MLTAVLQERMTSSAGIVRSIFLGLTIAVAPSAGAGLPDFTEIIIDAGFHVEQPVLAASLTGDTARHVVLAGRDDEHRQRLAVYKIGGDNAQPLLSLLPGASLIAYDVGRLGDRDALFFIEPGRIVRYDFAIEELVAVIDIRTIYGQERAGEIVPIDFFRDLNEDGLDDLVVTDTAGYRVRLQRADGSLGDEILLQDSSSMTVSGGIVSFESRPLVSGDMNFDGLVDLAVWRGNSMRVYAQLPGARFQSQPLIVPLGMDLLSEAELRVLQSNRGAVDQSDLTEKRIWSIGDLNNDQLPDILTEATLSEGVFDKRNEFRMHLGRQDGDRLVYREEEDALLASEGLQFGLIDTDIDGDRKKDLVVRKARLSFGRVIRALLSGKVSLQLQFFRMTADDDYPRRPNYETRTNVRFNLTSGQVDIPAIEVADFDGDGLQDLVIQTERGRLSFYHGVPNNHLFADKSVNRKVVLPRNGQLVATQDIDEDGRADLVIRYNVADGNGSGNTVRLLIASE